MCRVFAMLGHIHFSFRDLFHSQPPVFLSRHSGRPRGGYGFAVEVSSSVFVDDVIEYECVCLVVSVCICLFAF